MQTDLQTAGRRRRHAAAPSRGDGRPSIPLPGDVLDLLVERATARLQASAFVAEPWVGIDVAASHLACKRQRIYDLVSRRAIPHRKEGTRLLFKLSHLDAWIEGGGGT